MPEQEERLETRERIAKLEARADIAERAMEIFANESKMDRAKLHDSVERLTAAFEDWKSAQKAEKRSMAAYVAGVTSTVLLVASVIAFLWDKVATTWKG